MCFLLVFKNPGLFTIDHEVKIHLIIVIVTNNVGKNMKFQNAVPASNNDVDRSARVKFLKKVLNWSNQKFMRNCLIKKN